MIKSLMKNSGKYLAAAIMVLSIASVFNGCKDDDDDTPAPPAKGANEVWMENSKFNSATLTVTVNTTVKWTNKDGFDHNVVSDSSWFDSGIIPAGGTFSRQFTVAGTFPYTCTLHANMDGTIIVQ
ncbi:MAG TPA: plastocyanin/azurin family copper-binding protein [Bacteroidia bacterium]|nr:plastocyanin/azurin family copper-binding protein [Bacteroidia bacterium]